jgi:hypothetical protein
LSANDMSEVFRTARVMHDDALPNLDGAGAFTFTRRSIMPHLRPFILALAMAFSATAAAAIAVAPAVCADTISASIRGETVAGELFAEEVTSVTFVAIWWPGYPVVTVQGGTGWYQMSDGSVLQLRCHPTFTFGIPD